MTHDPRLVNAMCERAHPNFNYISPGAQDALRDMMRAALAAIDASGIAWVAPWEATEAMSTRTTDEFGWEEMRDAYLAERRGDAAEPSARVTVDDIERVLGRIPGISCWCRGDCLDPRRCWAEHLEAGGAPPKEYLDKLAERRGE
jgi:hypothetical protein